MGISLQLPEASPWRTIVRVLLLLLAEGSLITLIKDAPFFVVVATVLCPLVVLILLEIDGRLKGRYSPPFLVGISIIGLIYAGFIGYAIEHTMQRDGVNRELVSIYSSMAPFFKAGTDLNKLVKSDPEYPKAVSQYQQDYEAWEQKTGEWLAKNISQAAAEQFVDLSGMPQGCWSPPGQFCDPKLSATFVRFIKRKEKSRHHRAEPRRLFFQIARSPP
jgi:hypothetical protein